MTRKRSKSKGLRVCAALVVDPEASTGRWCDASARWCQLEIGRATVLWGAFGEAKVKEIDWVRVPLCKKHRGEG